MLAPICRVRGKARSNVRLPGFPGTAIGAGDGFEVRCDGVYVAMAAQGRTEEKPRLRGKAGLRDNQEF